MKILLLDIEGVMTRGMLGYVSLLRLFHCGVDGNYSRTATELVRALVKKHGFRIVLITRHGKNESDVLNKRLDAAGIQKEWLYAPDPDAIPDAFQSKGDSVAAWFSRNPAIRLHDTVAVEDHPESLRGYPAERIVAPDPQKGFVRADFEKVLAIAGRAFRFGRSASGPQTARPR